MTTCGMHFCPCRVAREHTVSAAQGLSQDVQCTGAGPLCAEGRLGDAGESKRCSTAVDIAPLTVNTQPRAAPTQDLIL